MIAQNAAKPTTTGTVCGLQAIFSYAASDNCKRENTTSAADFKRSVALFGRRHR